MSSILVTFSAPAAKRRAWHSRWAVQTTRRLPRHSLRGTYLADRFLRIINGSLMSPTKPDVLRYTLPHFRITPANGSCRPGVLTVLSARFGRARVLKQK